MTEPLNFLTLPETEMLEASQKFYQRLKQRRTVRDFSDKPVPEQVIRDAIMAAGTAPSGANMQPWHFAVTTDAKVKARIRVAAEIEERAFYNDRASQQWLDALHPLGTDANKPFLEIAPLLIGIFSKRFSFDVNGAKQKNYYTYESVGIACGMLISALHLSGLATLTHTPSPMAFLNEIFERPKTERPYLLLVVGYPNAACQVPQIDKKTFEEIATIVGTTTGDSPT